jgi:hypothetical protein
VAIVVSVMRRRWRRLVQAAALGVAAIAVACMLSCDRPPEPAQDPEISTGAMTEDEFVDHLAALTVAVEDGLSGYEATDRAAELGGGRYTREEIEAFADALSADPVRWAAVADRVDRRVAEIRSAPDGSGRTLSAGAGDPDGSETGAGTDRPRVGTDDGP